MSPWVFVGCAGVVVLMRGRLLVRAVRRRDVEARRLELAWLGLLLPVGVGLGLDTAGDDLGPIIMPLGWLWVLFAWFRWGRRRNPGGRDRASRAPIG